MANIEELDFQLIIKDEEFNKQIKAVEKAALDLNTSLTNILDIKKKIDVVSNEDVKNAKNLNKILVDTAKAEEKIRKEKAYTDSSVSARNEKDRAQAAASVAKSREQEAREVIKTMTAQEKLNRLQKENNKSLLSSARLFSSFGSELTKYLSFAGVKTLVSNITRVTAEFEYQKTTLSAILQDANMAEHIFEQIKDLAVQSPFAFKELVSYVKQLSAYSIPVEELYDTTKMLADVSSGLGVGMDRLVLAYGQIRSASFLRGQEVRQLTEAGIPILEELRKQFVELGEEGITVGEVFDKISARMVPFEMVEKVFKNMTTEGGKFYRMQEVQAETLKGKIMNLKDAYQIMFAEIGDKNKGVLTGTVDAIRNLALNYEKVGKAIVSLVAAYGTYKATALAVKLIEETTLIARANHIKKTEALGKAIKILSAESATYASIQKAISSINVWAVVGAAVAAVSAYLISASVQAAKFKKELDGIAESQANAAEKTAREFDVVVKKLENATKGSQNYRDAISELNRKYGEYLPNLLNEKNALEEVARAHNQVTASIYAQARAYAESEGKKKIEDKYGTGIGDAGLEILNRLKESGIGEEAAKEFLAGFRAELEKGVEKREVLATFDKEFESYFGMDMLNPFMALDKLDWQKYIGDYAKAVEGMRKANDDFTDALDARFGTQGYSSLKEREAIEPIVREWTNATEQLKKEQLSQEEYDNKLLEYKKKELTQIVEKYRELNRELEGTPQAGAWNNQITETLAALERLEGSEKDLSWLQKLVNPLVGAGNNDLKVKEGEDYAEYIDNIRKEYAKTKSELEDATKTYKKYTDQKQKGLEVDEQQLTAITAQYDSLKERKSLIESIGTALGVSIDDKVKGTSKSTGKSAEQTDLEIRINTLKDLYTWYEKFKDAGASSQSIRDILTTYFPDESDVIAGEKYTEVLAALADALEKYDRKAAQSLRDEIGVGGLNNELQRWKNLKKTAEEYDEFMSNWLDVSELEGEGITFKISSIVANYRKKLEEIEKKKREAREKLYAREDAKNPGARYGLDFAHEFVLIDEKALKEENNALASASEEARKEIEKFYKDAKEGTIDFNNLSDKSINQLRKMKDQISELMYADFDPSTIERLKELGFSVDDIIAAMEKMAQEDLEKLDLEIDEKKVKMWKGIAENILNVADALGELGEAAGNQQLVDFANFASTLGDVAKNTLQGFTSGGVAGAVVSGVSTLAVKFLEAATNAERIKNDLKEIATQAYLDDMSKQIAASSTIFGDSWLGKVTMIQSKIVELKRELNSLGRATGGSTAFGTYHAVLLDRLTKYGKELGMALYDEDGTFNSAFLEAVDTAYSKDLKKVKIYDEFQRLRDYNDALKKRFEELNDAIGQIFSDIGESITDELIDKLWQTGEVVSDLEDVFQGLGNTIMKSLIQSIVVDEILSKYRDQVTSWFTTDMSADQLAEEVDRFANNVREDIESSGDVIKAIFDAFSSRNLISGGEASESALTSGIKGVTEETASLLASYINAIRADVAYNRLQLEDVRGDVRMMVGLLPSTPTLAEYLTQIQANTFNTAARTEAILLHLEELTTAEGGAAALRVFM